MASSFDNQNLSGLDARLDREVRDHRSSDWGTIDTTLFAAPHVPFEFEMGGLRSRIRPLASVAKLPVKGWEVAA